MLPTKIAQLCVCAIPTKTKNQQKINYQLVITAVMKSPLFRYLQNRLHTFHLALVYTVNVILDDEIRIFPLESESTSINLTHFFL